MLMVSMKDSSGSEVPPPTIVTVMSSCGSVPAGIVTIAGTPV